MYTHTNDRGNNLCKNIEYMYVRVIERYNDIFSEFFFHIQNMDELSILHQMHKMFA